MNKEDLKEKWGIGTSASNDKSPPLTSSDQSSENQSSSVESECYAIDTQSNFIKSILFKKRQGVILYMPYSWQPSIEYNPNDGLYIKSLQKTIHITGRGLEPLVHAFGAQSVKWVKESATGVDDKENETFIIDIEFLEPD